MVRSGGARAKITKRRRSGAKKAKLLRPIPPDQPAARDEGPRLIPLVVSKEPSRLEHYLDLADTALGGKRFEP
jgi:hypothetical protein